ncbi:MAG: fused MFS/spermidine synthase [Acidobacteriota bacterium]|jgi:hypothetical protein
MDNPRRRRRVSIDTMLALYVLATFLAATLTFLLQPFAARLILPLFGGTPSVWNTSVLFFQALLLAGYAYAAAVTKSTRRLRWAAVHLTAMALVLLTLPVHIDASWAPSPTAPPLLWQTWLLLATIGAPFFIVAASAPLLQRWFSLTGHPAAGDPYFLYAASNLGSLLALLSYPLAIEPALDLVATGRLWTAGYVLLLALIAGCATGLRRAGVAPVLDDGTIDGPPPRDLSGQLRWAALAAVPSSLMLSVTTYISTDIAAAPLLWVVPLALYLLTYVVAFAPRRFVEARSLERLMPLAVILLTITLLARGLEPPPWLMLTLHLGGLVVVALACHGQLAELRPPVSRLTRYYLWIAAGGLTGGVFNALLAPALFTGVAEYPLALVAACLLRRPPLDAPTDALPRSARQLIRRDLAPAACLALGAYALALLAPRLGLPGTPGLVGLALGVPALVAYLFLMRPVRFALAIGALFLVAGVAVDVGGQRLFARRTYYGIHRVEQSGQQRRLYHGRTLHGIESTDPSAGAEPLAYYHRSGPAGSLFRALGTPVDGPRRIAVIGLGVATLAAYARPGEHWTFYELDPTVLYVARDSGLFTYWADSAGLLDATVGDARIRLTEYTGARYDLLVLDAFSADAIPVHLLTREALSLYRRRLRNNGALAIHISNRFLDLEGVVQALAADAGLEALAWADLLISDAQREEGKLPSHWVVLSTDTDLIDRLAASGPWRHLSDDARTAVWSDQFSNLLRVIRWRGSPGE